MASESKSSKPGAKAKKKGGAAGGAAGDEEDNRPKLVLEELGRLQLAHLAENALLAARYADMLTFVEAMARRGEPLDMRQKNLVSIAFKRVVEKQLHAWHTLAAAVHVDHQSQIDSFKQDVGRELVLHVQRLLELIKNDLIPTDKSPSGHAFYYKLAGDFCRYACEVTTGDERQEHGALAELNYEYATEVIAANRLPPTNVIRLGLALNYALFLHQITHRPQEAKDLLKHTLNAAAETVTTLKDPEFGEVTTLLLLMRDQLAAWESAQT